MDADCAQTHKHTAAIMAKTETEFSINRKYLFQALVSQLESKKTKVSWDCILIKVYDLSHNHIT